MSYQLSETLRESVQRAETETGTPLASGYMASGYKRDQQELSKILKDSELYIFSFVKASGEVSWFSSTFIGIDMLYVYLADEFIVRMKDGSLIVVKTKSGMTEMSEAEFLCYLLKSKTVARDK